MRRGKWVAALILMASLLVPVSAAGHPFAKQSAGFMPELPEGFSAESGELVGGPAVFASAPPATYDKTDNLRFMGFSARPAANLSVANSDIAFQGRRAYQGTFPGFRIVDISQPANPREVINYEDCRHPSGQGDVVVYRNILTRSWDSASANNMPAGGWPCGESRVQAGEEGLHIFDVSDETAPKVAKFIDLPCGSHTATGVPDRKNGRLLVYSTPSSGACDGIDIISVPLDDPSQAEYLRFEPSADLIACHDTGVILGKVLRAACAGGQGFAVWSLDPREGGSLEDPKLMYVKNMKTEMGININTGHSAAFTNDGSTLIFGHEPGGGTAPRCLPTGTVISTNPNAQYPVQTDDMKSFFFFDTERGELQGKWTLPRPQTVTENCTLHNYNVVPTHKRDILVHGSYQSGIGVLDFTDRNNPKEIGYADPKPLNPDALVIGGDWSSHYYNGHIWQSDITRGLLSWDFAGKELRGARKLPRLNPQTQEFTAYSR